MVRDIPLQMLVRCLPNSDRESCGNAGVGKSTEKLSHRPIAQLHFPF